MYSAHQKKKVSETAHLHGARTAKLHAKQVIMMAEISNDTPLSTDSDPLASSDSEND